MTSTRPRRAVTTFAKDMEKRLRANDRKGRRGWESCSLHWLLDRLTEERDELLLALHGISDDGSSVIDEAADVANFAMMIADNARSLNGARP
jgi:NTP pyrophosphatase (non-canonical NTP hydrolase)